MNCICLDVRTRIFSPFEAIAMDAEKAEFNGIEMN